MRPSGQHARPPEPLVELVLSREYYKDDDCFDQAYSSACADKATLLNAHSYMHVSAHPSACAHTHARIHKQNIQLFSFCLTVLGDYSNAS